MAKVHNWHLGREMQYRFDEAQPQRQFVAVFNTNRCIACQTCTLACKSTWTFSRGQEYMWWNNVETKPYGGYPHPWDGKLLPILDEDTPKGPEGHRNEYHREGTELPEHKTWFFYLQRICNHCTYPGCLGACPRKAIYKRPEDGIVLIDQKRCRGYRKCVEQCPYKKPMFRGLTRISEKCIACYPRIEGRDPITKGRPMETRCMSACVGQIRLQGFLDDNPKNPVTWLIRHDKVALPSYPQFGTEPNIYYIPPRWAPRAYLRQMFGPGVDEAIDKFMVPSRERLAVMSLFRMTQTIVFEYKIEEGPKVFETTIHGKKFEMYNDTVIGYGEDGQEIVRTTIEEPIYIRDPKHYNSI